MSTLPRETEVLFGYFASQPPALATALADRIRAGDHDEVQLRYMHATDEVGEILMQVDLMDVLKVYPFYIGSHERALVKAAGDRKVVFFVPGSFSDIPGLVRRYLTPDVFLLLARVRFRSNFRTAVRDFGCRRRDERWRPLRGEDRP